MEPSSAQLNADTSTPRSSARIWHVPRPSSAPKEKSSMEIITPLTTRELGPSKIPVITPKPNKVVSRASSDWPAHGIRFDDVINDTSLTPINVFGRAMTAGSVATTATVVTKLSSNELKEDDSVSCFTNSSTSTPCNPKKRKLETEALPFFKYNKLEELSKEEKSMSKMMADPEMNAWINESLETVKDYEKIEVYGLLSVSSETSVSRDSDNGGWDLETKGFDHFVGVSIDVELTLGLLQVQGGHFRNILVLSLSLFLLQFERDTSDWTFLNSLHQVGGVTGDLVSESLGLDLSDFAGQSLVDFKVQSQFWIVFLDEHLRGSLDGLGSNSTLTWLVYLISFAEPS